MLIKVRARQLGKRIKKETDIPHIPAMKIGKMLAQDKSFGCIQEKFPEYVFENRSDCTCCGLKRFLGIQDNQRQLELTFGLNGLV